MVDEAVGVGAAAMKSLCNDVESLCLVKECHELGSIPMALDSPMIYSLMLTVLESTS